MMSFQFSDVMDMAQRRVIIEEKQFGAGDLDKN